MRTECLGSFLNFWSCSHFWFFLFLRLMVLVLDFCWWYVFFENFLWSHLLLINFLMMVNNGLCGVRWFFFRGFILFLLGTGFFWLFLCQSMGSKENSMGWLKNGKWRFREWGLLPEGVWLVGIFLLLSHVNYFHVEKSGVKVMRNSFWYD